MKPDLFEAPDYYNLDDLLTDEHKLIRDSAREWVKKSVSPIIEEYAQKAEFQETIANFSDKIVPLFHIHAVIGFTIIKKQPANASPFISVAVVEILVATFFVVFIKVFVVLITSGFTYIMKMLGVFFKQIIWS